MNSFEVTSSSFSARKHKWEDEMTWLLRDQVPQGYWQNEENVIEESKSIQREQTFQRLPCCL